jgi:hypothetical protein
VDRRRLAELRIELREGEVHRRRRLPRVAFASSVPGPRPWPMTSGTSPWFFSAVNRCSVTFPRFFRTKNLRSVTLSWFFLTVNLCIETLPGFFHAKNLCSGTLSWFLLTANLCIVTFLRVVRTATCAA